MTRVDREDDDRDAWARTEEWAPASTLPEPKPMDGWRFKWVRRLSLGDTDIMNMSKRRREGWEPVSAEDQPDLAAYSDNPGVIEIGGLLLCKMPESRAQARERYFADRSSEQLDGLNRQLKKEAKADESLGKIFEERKTTVSRSA